MEVAGVFLHSIAKHCAAVADNNVDMIESAIFPAAVLKLGGCKCSIEPSELLRANRRFEA